MTQLETLETKLDEFLHKKAPVQLPEGGRAWIARNAWWLALIGGISLLWSTLSLWRVGHTVDRMVETVNYWAGQPYVHHLGAGYYLSLLLMGITGIVMLVAAANLKEMRRTGWLYLFYAMLLQVVAAVLLLFTSYGGFGDFIGSLLSAVVGGYFLFQIRSYFTGVHGVDTAPAAKQPVADHKASPAADEPTNEPKKPVAAHESEGKAAANKHAKNEK